MRKILIMILSLWALGVQAQQSVPAIRGEVNTYFPTNNAKQIQAVKLRETFNDVLDHVDTLNKKKYGKTIAQIRLIANTTYEIVYVLDSGKQGWFYYDSADTSTSDDNNNTIVSANGRRYKRSVILAPVVSVNGKTGVVILNKDDIFGIDSIETNDIKSDAVTYAKIQNVATNQRALGRTSGAGGNVEELSLSQMLDWASSTQGTLLYRGAATWSALGVGVSGQMLTTAGAGANPSWSYPVQNGDKGDITASSNGATWTIDGGVVTYSKIQNISATQRLLGRNTAGAGVTEEVSASGVLDWIGSSRGQILFRGASGWSVLSPGTAGQVLSTGGAGADPSWVVAGGPPFASDISVNSLTVGRGGGSQISNSAFGYLALTNNTTGASNTAIGANALNGNIDGNTNVAVGGQSQRLASSGNNNTSIGYQSLEDVASGFQNSAVGNSALMNTTGSRNTGMGALSGNDVLGGSDNTFVGYNTGDGITTGAFNTIIGANVTGLSASLVNNIIIADGAGNRRINVDGSGRVGIGTNTPSTAAQVDITSTTGGLLLPRMTSTQRDAISSPPDGLLIYNSTTNKAQIRAASAWVDLH